jgi:hypothetical protein
MSQMHENITRSRHLSFATITKFVMKESGGRGSGSRDYASACLSVRIESIKYTTGIRRLYNILLVSVGLSKHINGLHN